MCFPCAISRPICLQVELKISLLQAEQRVMKMKLGAECVEQCLSLFIHFEALGNNAPNNSLLEHLINLGNVLR